MLERVVVVVGRAAVRADLLLVGALRQARDVPDARGLRAAVQSQVAEGVALELVQQKGLLVLFRVWGPARVLVLLLPYALGRFADNFGGNRMFFGAQ